MLTVANELIRASAGSGKTYALVTRYVRLLALGTAPSKIAALTFTRKTAGEFWEALLSRLITAARCAQAAEKLCEELELPGKPLGTDAFTALLKGLITNQHTARLTTLDSFFFNQLSAYWPELGLKRAPEIIEGAPLEAQQTAAFARVFEAASTQPAVSAALAEVFDAVFWGQSAKNLTPLLNHVMGSAYPQFLQQPVAKHWGNWHVLWQHVAGKNCPWLETAEGGAYAAAVEALLETPAQDIMQGVAKEAQRTKTKKNWQHIVENIASWKPGEDVDAKVLTFCIHFLKRPPSVQIENVGAGEPYAVGLSNVKLAMPMETALHLETAARFMFTAQLVACAQESSGQHGLCKLYHTAYLKQVQETGQLAFTDVPHVLSARSASPAKANWLAYRMDGVVDHWLLDEFQDTSLTQFTVLLPWLKEIAAEPTGQRSAFCVGDAKQSIFGWRSGEHRLFEKVDALFEGSLVHTQLNKSYRSAPEIINVVNAVFGNQSVLKQLDSAEVGSEWARNWQPHVSAKPELKGAFEWWVMDGEDAVEKSDTSSKPKNVPANPLVARVQRCIEKINTLNLQEESCAVLVNTNEEGALVEATLQQAGIPCESGSVVHAWHAHPFGQALLNLLRFVQEPADMFHFRMAQASPLGEVFSAQGLTTPAAVWAACSQLVYTEGFEAFIMHWARAVAEDAAAHQALRPFLLTYCALARELEGNTTQPPSVATFIQAASKQALPTHRRAGAVHILTIHKAKGLGFTHVFLPCLEGNTLKTPRAGALRVVKDAQYNPHWVGRFPTKKWLAADAILENVYTEFETEAAYEGLCALYVAFTRAEKGLYLVTEPMPKKETDTFTFKNILHRTLET